MFGSSVPRSAIKQNPLLAVPPRSYWALLGLRLLLVLIPQNGYIHPDEFFQSTEPIAGDVLDLDTVRCWEFNTTFPIRSLSLARVTVGWPLHLLSKLNSLTEEHLLTSILSPYVLLIAPRLAYFLLSLVNDYCLIKICVLYGQNVKNRLIIYSSSYVTLIFTTHTFSNSLEITLFSVLLLMVSECMFNSDRIIFHNEFLREKYEKAETVVDRVRFYKLRNSLPDHSLSKCFKIATLIVIGIFNRPTFIGFAFPSVFFWLVRGLGTKYIGFKDFHLRVAIFLSCSLPTILLLILLDSVYYGYLTMAEVNSLEISMNNFVVTPLNFLKHNLLTENLSEHGLHPRWLHALVNLPLLFNVLGLAGLAAVIRMVYRFCRGSYNMMPRVRSITGLMTFSFITPLAALSVFPHQEPRFLLPIILPLVFLYSHYLLPTDNDSKQLRNIKNAAFSIWCIFNLILSIFYGFVHQGGVYYVAKHFNAELKTKPRATNVHLVTSHVYNIPQHLLQAESTSKLRIDPESKHKYRLAKQMFLYELGSKNLDEVLKQVKAVWDVSQMVFRSKKQDFRLYVVLPSSLKSQLGDAWFKANATSLTLKEEFNFFPHLSTEAMPYFPTDNDQSCFYEWRSWTDTSWSMKLSMWQRFTCFLRQFSLVLYKVDVSKYLTIDSFDASSDVGYRK